MVKSLFSIAGIFLFALQSLSGQELFKAPAEETETRWVSPENPTGGKGQGGKTNKGAKGNAFYIVAPGEKKVLLDVKGAGIIKKMWMSGSIALNPEQRRAVRIDMFWDGSTKPAVSAPIGDFFGMGLGVMASFDNELFGNPESRSFNCHISMPYRKAARIEITNESKYYVLYWFDINYLQVQKLDDDVMYFHTYWNRVPATSLGKDYEILPFLKGKGRYIGANIGVIGNPDYRGTWFGEGEVKVYLDGDTNLPTLVGTGTEDYIGSGWGQGKFNGRYYGSLLADKDNDLYSFYRYHIIDPVYFHQDCRVTIQQMGNAELDKIKSMISKKAKLIPVWTLETKGRKDIVKLQGEAPTHKRLLDERGVNINNSDYPTGGTNFYRSDDVSATAYFYLDKPESNLPVLPPVQLRMKDMKEKVFDKVENSAK
jgi:hypothetical protein